MDQNRQAKATHVREVKGTDPDGDGQREQHTDTPGLGSWSDVVWRAAAGLGLDAPSGAEAGPLHSRSGSVIVRAEGVVLKLHAEGCDGEALRSRLRLALASPVLLSPLAPAPLRILTPVGERWVSAWPAVQPLRAGSEEEVPWLEVGRLIARLHLTSAAGPDAALSHGGLARLRRTAVGLAGLGAPHWLVQLAERTADGLARPIGERALVHGDLHLGQVGRDPGGRLLLFDVDDLGVGDPAYDLGKIAGLWAAGQLGHDSWEELLAGYRAGGGPGLSPEGDPWGRLDLPARAGVLITLFGLLRERAEGGEVAENLLQDLMAACARMSDLPA